MQLIPAFVDMWDGATMRVFIDGYINGADIGLKAEVLFPFSDRPDYTGFHIEKGDPVWVVFNNDDPNQPIVIGYRNFNTGENKDTRRWRHRNIETHATERMCSTTKTYEINANEQYHLTAPKIILTGDVKIEGELVITKNSTATDHLSSGISGKGHTHSQNSGNHYGGGATTTPPK